MTRGKRPDVGEAGISIPEMMVGLALTAIVIALFATAYKTLTKGDRDLGSVTRIQRDVKALSQELDREIKRAGFGLKGAGVFTNLSTDRLRFRYLDPVGTHCAIGDTATLSFASAAGVMTRELSCNGVKKAAKVLGAGTDKVNLTFRYLNAKGVATGASADVRLIEYTVDGVGKTGSSAAKQRVSKGSVSVVNNS